MKIFKLALAALLTTTSAFGATSTTAGNSGQSVPPQVEFIGGKDFATGFLQPVKIDSGGSLAVSMAGGIAVTSSALPVGASTSALQVSANGLSQSALSQLQAGLAVTSSALPSGASTSALQTTGNTSLSSIDSKTPSLGQATMANSSPVVIASNQSAVPVSGSGNFTVVQPTGTNLHAVIDSGTVTLANGTSTTQAVSGTVTVNGGVAVTTNADTGVTAGSAPAKAILGAVQYNSTSPVLTTGQTVATQSDASGSQKMVMAGPSGTLNLVRPDAELRVANDPTSMFYDTYDTALDTTNRWTTAGTVVPTSTAGQLTVSAGTVALATSVLTSQPSFQLLGNQFNLALGIIQVDSGTKTGAYRFFGFGTAQASPTVALPVLNGVGYEWSDTDGILRGVVWSNGTKTQTVSLSASQPTDGALHRYAIYYKTSRVYFELDNVSVGTLANPNPQLSILPALYLNVNGASTVSPAAVFVSTLAATADTSRNSSALNDGAFPWRKQTVTAAGHTLTDTYDGGGTAISSQASPVNTNQRYLNSAVIGDDPAIVTNAISALNGDVYPSLDLTGYAGASVQITGAFTATVSFQGSNDGFTTVSAVNCWSTITVNAAPVTSTAAAGTFWCPRVYKQFRVRVSAYTSGTITGNTQAMVVPPDDPFLRNAILVSGTVTTVTTVTTVSTDNLAANNTVTDLASTAKTTTFTQATVTPASGQISEAFQIAVTVVSGTTPTMDCVVNESYDSGTNFQQVYAFERITATGFYTTPMLRIAGNRVNYVCTIAGTTPSFTMSIARVGSQVATNFYRRYFDRTIAPNSGASTTASFNIAGCTNISYGVADAAQTTPATFDLQLSEDNSVFEKQGTTIAPAANAAASINNIPLLSKWAQIVVTNAGSGETLNYAWLNCEGP